MLKHASIVGTKVYEPHVLKVFVVGQSNSSLWEGKKRNKNKNKKQNKKNKTTIYYGWTP
jgi:hypothetical protein